MYIVYLIIIIIKVVKKSSLLQHRTTKSLGGICIADFGNYLLIHNFNITALPCMPVPLRTLKLSNSCLMYKLVLVTTIF